MRVDIVTNVNGLGAVVGELVRARATNSIRRVGTYARSLMWHEKTLFFECKWEPTSHDDNLALSSTNVS